MEIFQILNNKSKFNNMVSKNYKKVRLSIFTLFSFSILFYVGVFATPITYASVPVQVPESETSCTTQTVQTITGSVNDANATLNIPTGACPIKISFSSYSHKGTILPFEDQILTDNITSTYGPGTHNLGPIKLACNWQTDLYVGDTQTKLDPIHGHSDLIAYDYVEKQNCDIPQVNTPPTITLLGANPFNLTVDTMFVDPGATATDTEDGNLTSKIIKTGTVNASTTGSYILTYTVTDSGKLATSTTRVVNVVPVVPPITACNASTELITNGGFEYPVVNLIVNKDGTYQKFPFGAPGLGWISYNIGDGPFSQGLEIVVSDPVSETDRWAAHFGNQYNEIELGPKNDISQNISTIPGQTYTFSYWISPHPIFGNFTDSMNDVNVYAGGKLVEHLGGLSQPATIWSLHTHTFTATTTTTRVSFIDQHMPESQLGMFLDDVSVRCGSSITVNTPPTITLLGANPFNLTVDTMFVDPGATATDTEDGNLTSKIIKTGTVNASTTGSYILTYTVTDSGGLSANVTRTVVVNPVGCTSNCGGGGSTPNADLAVTKTADKSTPNVGDTVTYKVSVVNNGPDVATLVSLKDMLPSGLNFVSAVTTLGSYSSTTGLWTIGNLLNTASTTLTITVTVNTGTQGQKITNTAVATSTRADSNLVNNTVSTDITVNTPGGGGNGGGGGGGGGNGGGGGSIPGGHRQDISGLVGTQQGEILGATSCYYLRDYLKIDWKNDPIEVLKIQSFLNVFEAEHLPLTGVYEQNTFDAVARFQTKYSADILTPWGPKVTKGFTYLLTKKKVNEIYCNAMFPINQSEQNEINAFKSFGENYLNSTINGANGSLSNDSNISGVVNSSTVKNPLVVALKGTSTAQSVVKNIAISLFALPQKIFSSGKIFIIFLILIIIAVVVTRLLTSKKKNPDVSVLPLTSVAETKTNNKKVSPPEKKSPVVVSPGVLPDEEIIIENPEEGPEEIIN